MIQKFVRYLRKEGATLPRIYSENYKPKNLRFDYDELGKMFTLKLWHIQNSNSTRSKEKNLREIEELHNELTFLQARDMTRRYVAMFAIFFMWYFFWIEPNENRHDFRKNFDQKFTLKLYNELDEGGIEGG